MVFFKVCKKRWDVNKQKKGEIETGGVINPPPFVHSGEEIVPLQRVSPPLDEGQTTYLHTRT